MTEAEREQANRDIVDRVLDAFEPALARLDLEVEPAVIYRIHDDTRD